MANWIKTIPTSGTGPADIQVTSNGENSGRNSRSGQLMVKLVDDSQYELRNVNQAGKEEFVDIDDTAIVPNTGGGHNHKRYI